MRAILSTFATLLGCSLTVAAPVPKEKLSTDAQIEKLFGKPIRPEDGKYSFTLDKETLTLQVPETPRLWDGRGVPNCPRTEREIAGDFTLSVRITVTRPDEKLDAFEAQAGLFVLASEGNSLTHSRLITRRNGRDGRGGLLRNYRDGRIALTASSAGGAFDPDSTYHKIQRVGNTITAFARAKNPDAWHKVGTYAFAMGDSIKVGVYVENTSGPYSVLFSEFDLDLHK